MSGKKQPLLQSRPHGLPQRRRARRFGASIAANGVVTIDETKFLRQWIDTH